MTRNSHPWEDNWEFGERLGKGGQGLTHLVTRKSEPSEEAALKILKNNRDSQARRRMHREVAALEVLSPEGGSVPQVIEHNTQEHKDPSTELYVVMEYIPGTTLGELVVDGGSMSIENATAVTLKICETIELAHTHSILHRDLKPENIMVRDLDNADVVIVDYGLSFNQEDPDITATEETFRNRFCDLPETNTPGGNRRDPRSDITAACAVYYFLLTGHTPGQLQDGEGRLPHMRPGFSLSESLPDSPIVRQLEILFNRGFAPNLGNRYQTIAELRDRISLMTRAGASDQPEDPIAVAERASNELRQRDRKTQLKVFQKHAVAILTTLVRTIQKYQNKLGHFMLQVEYDNRTGMNLPADLDRVTPNQLKLQLNAENHSHIRAIIYAVGSRGEQCVILRQRYFRDGEQGNISPADEYEELLWYDAATVPDLGPINTDIKNCINAAIQELSDLVFGG